MAQGVTLKNPIWESHLFRGRTIFAAAAAILMMLILISRLFYLQVISHNHYTTLSDNNRVNTLPIAPTRGLIYDRNGIVLAENLPRYSLDLVPERVEGMENTLESISKLIEISDSELDRFRKYLKHKRRFEAIPLRFQLSDEEVAKVAVNLHQLAGVEINSRLSRHYPLGPLMAHSVGYVGRMDVDDLKKTDSSNYRATTHIGKTGLENAYENTLHGQVGHQRVETNARGRILRVLERTAPVPGHNLILNIDARLQKTAEKAFANNRGALIAMEPETGAILSLVSTPSYDPNLFVNGIDTKTYHAIRDSPDQPLFNRALQGQYPPGSITKPFVGLAGLESKITTPKHKVDCHGYYMLENDDRRYRDWKKEGHGSTNLYQAIKHSCDVYFYDLSLNLGIDRISAIMKAFGFGSKTGIDIGGEANGLIPSREWKQKKYGVHWFPGETLISGIGQGYMLTTPLQLAASTAALSIGGKRMQPQLVKTIENTSTGVQQHIENKLLTTVEISTPANWQAIIRAMKAVVHDFDGTAQGINRGLQYNMAGKTGTAQVFGVKQDEEYIVENIAKRLQDHALFIAFAPVEKPRIAVALIVENGGSGSRAAAPIARKLIDQYLLNTPAITTELPE